MKPLTLIHLRRLNSSIYAIYELIKSYKLDNHEFITDTLLQAHYGIGKIVEEMEDEESEEYIKHTQQHN